MAKGLSHFESFDAIRYFKNKTLMLMNSEELTDFATKEVLGAKYTVIVWADETEYAKDDITNRGDTFSVKVEGKQPKKFSEPIEISLINPSVKVYGEFRNQLSVTAEDIRFNTKLEKS